MRSFTTALVAAFLAASAVVAQDQVPGKQSWIMLQPCSSLLSRSACLAACSTAAPASCATVTDPNAAQKCACEDKGYVANSTACLEVTCTSQDEFNTAQLLAVSVCAQQVRSRASASDAPLLT